MPALWESTRQIFSQLISQCETVQFPAPWHGLKVAKRTMCMLHDAEHTLNSLREEWDEQELIQSGLLRRSGGSVVIAKRLDCESPLLPLRQKKADWPCEVIGGRGNLTYRGLPFICALQDYQTKQQLQNSDRCLFLTTDIWDAAVLRALGLPAITAAGLANAKVSELNELSRRFGWLTDDGDDHDVQSTDESLRLVLVGWRVCSMELIEPRGVSALTDELVSIERNLDLDLQSVGIWKPIEADLERARFFLARNEFALVKDAFITSTRDCCCSMASFTDSKGEPADLISTLDQLRDSIAAEVPSHSFEAARQHFEFATNRDLVEPLLRRALSTSDPFRRTLGVMAADINQMFCALMPETLAASDHNSVEFQQLIRQQLALSARFVGIVNAMKQKK